MAGRLRRNESQHIRGWCSSASVLDYGIIVMHVKWCFCRYGESERGESVNAAYPAWLHRDPRYCIVMDLKN